LAEERQRVPLLEYLVARMRLPWYVASGIIAIILLLLLLLAAYLDGPLAERLDWGHLRGPLLPLTIVVYVLIIYPLMGRLRDRTLLSLMPLLDSSNSGRELVVKVFSTRKRWEIVAVLTGIVLGILLTLPWLWVNRPLAFYAAVIDILMFGILGLIVYESMKGTLRLSRLFKRHIKVDIFTTSQLVPVANWSLGIAIAFLGGICISIAFQTVDSLLQIPTMGFYAILILVALIVFFFSMWSTHTAIVRAKKVELTIISNKLDHGFRELREKNTQTSTQNPDNVNSAIAAWATYEQRVQQVSEWPYDARIVRRLAASVLVPGIVYLLKLLLGINI